jgi:hypothetical protein
MTHAEYLQLSIGKTNPAGETELKDALGHVVARTTSRHHAQVLSQVGALLALVVDLGPLLDRLSAATGLDPAIDALKRRRSATLKRLGL